MEQWFSIFNEPNHFGVSARSKNFIYILNIPASGTDFKNTRLFQICREYRPSGNPISTPQICIQEFIMFRAYLRYNEVSCT